MLGVRTSTRPVLLPRAALLPIFLPHLLAVAAHAGRPVAPLAQAPDAELEIDPSRRPERAAALQLIDINNDD